MAEKKIRSGSETWNIGFPKILSSLQLCKDLDRDAKFFGTASMGKESGNLSLIGFLLGTALAWWGPSAGERSNKNGAHTKPNSTVREPARIAHGSSNAILHFHIT